MRDLRRAMEAIEATCAACSLYGADHRVTSVRAAEGATLLRVVGAITLCYFSDRVLADRTPLPVRRDTLLERFVRARGSNAIVIPPVVSEADVRRLARAVVGVEARGGAIEPFRLSRASIGHAGAEAHPGVTRAMSALPDVIMGIRRDQPLPANSLDGIVTEILASATISAGSLLPLAGLKNHDEYTFVHTVNVGVLASALGASVGLTGQALHDLTAAALLHDVGKVVIPRSVLNKPGALSDDEMRLVRRHPGAGAALLYAQPNVPAVAVLVAYEHHQHLDGGGYPGEVRARRPSLASQIVQVADVHDALRTHRPYRPAMTEVEAVATMQTMAGRQFDPQLFEQFLQLLPGVRRPDTLPNTRAA